jgi:hypothetical protein
MNTYILSTGLTGTTFLTSNFETMDVNVQNYTNIKNSRYINVLSNALLKYKYFQTYLFKFENITTKQESLNEVI